MTATSETAEAKTSVANLQVAAFPEINDRVEFLREMINLPARSVCIDQIGLVLAETQDAGVIVLYSRPERSLLRAMADGRSPSEAMKTWQQAAEQCLLDWRRNRKRVLLVHDEIVLRNPSAFIESLHARLGVEVDLKTNPPAMESDESFEELHRLIAAQMVAQSSETQDLLVELEAASVLTSIDELQPVNCESLFQEMNGRTAALAVEHETLQARFKDQEEENKLLLLQLHQVQEESENYYKQAQEQGDKLRASERALQEVNERVAALAEERETLMTRCKDQEEEGELLLLQLHQVQEELEQYYLQLQELTAQQKKLETERDSFAKEKIAARNAANRNEQALKAAQKDNRDLQDEVKKLRLKITAINRSTSWRLTKPLRFIVRLFKRSKSAVSNS